MALWRERSGAFSSLKAGALVLACAPAIWIAMQAAFGWLGKRPVTDAIHQTGDWAIYLLLATLLVTPLRRIANWPRLILVRRTLGVSVACYASLHFALYILDQKFDLVKVATEIALRFYLTIGFAALIALITLASTSTDSAVKRLGAERWNRLHRLVYPVGFVSLFHYFLQTKIDVTQPVLISGMFLLLMGFRLMQKRGWTINALSLAGLAVAGGVSTAALEILWYRLATGIDPWRILSANLDFDYSIRPMWWVMLAGTAAALVAILRPPLAQRTRSTARATAA